VRCTWRRRRRRKRKECKGKEVEDGEGRYVKREEQEEMEE
jgi:hypothetical protein